MTTATIGSLLRAPGKLALTLQDDRQAASLAGTSLACLVAGTAAFGAAVGSLRGGAQIAAAAVKMPLALLGALIVACPAFFALAAVFGRPMSVRSMTGLALAAGARGALVLLACAPPLALAIDLGLPYDATKLVAVAVYALAGLCAFGLFAHGLGDGRGRAGALASMAVVLLLAGAQSAWILRPFLGDPSDRHLAWWVQGERREGGLGGALLRSIERLATRRAAP